MAIVLIGMPGAGKTSLGKILSKKMNLPHIDTDVEIERLENRSIAEIFAIDGEDYFRKIETEVLAKFLDENAIISTGGGIVEREENLTILRKYNAFVVFLDRPLENIINDIEISSRPLLAGGKEKLEEIYLRRYNKYLAFADEKIINTGSIFEVADLVEFNIRKNRERTIKLAVIGSPIEHSLSPKIHQAIFAELGEKLDYFKINVKKGELEDFIKFAKGENIEGFNLTMPHKVDILPYLDYIDNEAKAYSSVNTVKIKDNKLYGYNTDGSGFKFSLEQVGYKIENSNIVILGAGGVVRTLAILIGKSNGKSLAIFNRTIEKAKEITEMISKYPCKTSYGKIYSSEMEIALKNADILINATPLGMAGFENDFKNLDFLKLLPKEALVCDLIYNPAETEFLKRAKANGNPTLNGYGMLIFQAILADEIFLNQKIDKTNVYKNIINN